jgi:hypothetical protein
MAPLGVVSQMDESLLVPQYRLSIDADASLGFGMNLPRPPDAASPLPVSPFTELILRQYGWNGNIGVAFETLG